MTRLLRCAAFGAALIVASCAAPQPTPEPGAEAAAPQPAPAAPKTAAPQAPDTSPSAPAQVALAKPKPAPAPEPRMTLGDLIGLNEGQLTESLGRPAFKRVDDPAALWQYRGTRCILDLFLYADGPAYRVTHVEVRRRGGGQPAEQPLDGTEADRCFTELLPTATDKG